MDDIIIIAVLLLIIGLASFYVYKAKKSGKKCIGCPDSGCCGGDASKKGAASSCSGNCASCSCGCGSVKK